MSALNKALSHITHGTAYSWDLTVLLSFGIPVSAPLRQKMLSGATTKADADRLRALLRAQQKSRVAGMESTLR